MVNIGDLSTSSQDYIKMVWNLQEWSGDPVSTSAVAQALGVTPPAVSSHMKKMQEAGLVVHARYSAISLTEEGEHLARLMVRRHRLVETFLAEVLGYSWDEVHDDAEKLEHVISDTMLNRIDAHLNYPTTDPHGDPIPRADGTIVHEQRNLLSAAPLGVPLRIVRVHDRHPSALTTLTSGGIYYGATIIVESRTGTQQTIRLADADGPRTVLTGDEGDAIAIARVPQA